MIDRLRHSVKFEWVGSRKHPGRQDQRPRRQPRLAEDRRSPGVNLAKRFGKSGRTASSAGSTPKKCASGSPFAERCMRAALCLECSAKLGGGGRRSRVERPVDEQVTVMVVDDHRLFREGVRKLLEEHQVTVVAEAEDAASAVALAAECTPDVALMDLSLPGASGIDATKRVLRVSPHTGVLILSVSAAEDDIFEAIHAGACGYLLKDSSAEEILAGIGAAAAGQSTLSPQVAALLLRRFRRSPRATELAEPVVPKLTERELEVLSLIAAGKENAEIADALVISQHTVKNHVSAILDKLGLENRIQAAVFGVRKGLV